MEIAIESLAALEPRRLVLEQERERLRGEQADARTAAQAVQTAARDIGGAGGVAARGARDDDDDAGACREAARRVGAAPRRTGRNSSRRARRRSPRLQDQIEAALQIRVQIDGRAARGENRER